MVWWCNSCVCCSHCYKFRLEQSFSLALVEQKHPQTTVFQCWTAHQLITVVFTCSNHGQKQHNPFSLEDGLLMSQLTVTPSSWKGSGCGCSVIPHTMSPDFLIDWSQFQLRYNFMINPRHQNLTGTALIFLFYSLFGFVYRRARNNIIRNKQANKQKKEKKKDGVEIIMQLSEHCPCPWIVSISSSFVQSKKKKKQFSP